MSRFRFLLIASITGVVVLLLSAGSYAPLLAVLGAGLWLYSIFTYKISQKQAIVEIVLAIFLAVISVLFDGGDFPVLLGLQLPLAALLREA